MLAEYAGRNKPACPLQTSLPDRLRASHAGVELPASASVTARWRRGMRRFPWMSAPVGAMPQDVNDLRSDLRESFRAGVRLRRLFHAAADEEGDAAQSFLRLLRPDHLPLRGLRSFSARGSSGSACRRAGLRSRLVETPGIGCQIVPGHRQRTRAASNAGRGIALAVGALAAFAAELPCWRPQSGKQRG